MIDSIPPASVPPTIGRPLERKPNMKRRLHIAMVCDFFYPRLGGVENHIYSLSQHLIRLGHKVIIITHAYENRKGVRYLPGPLKVYYCPITPMVDQDALPSFTATLPLIRCILIREAIEIVHGHQATSTMANESIVYGSAMGIATVYTDHSLFGFDDLASVILNRVLQTTLATVDAAIAVSHACRDNLILRTRLDPSKVRIIPNALDPTKFTPDPTQRSKERITVVVVSRLVYRKGVDLLVGVIPVVCQVLPMVDFLVAGDGNRMLSLQEMVERERLHDRVTCLGSIAHSQVRDVLVRGHIFLNCSLTESFCIAIIEAASCGLVVVSTDVGGVPEVLPHDMIVLSSPNLPSMVDALRAAVVRQSCIDSWAEHERVKTMYSWHRVAVETEDAYMKVLAQDRMTLLDRLARYRSLGGLSGLFVAFLAVTVELWLRFVEWWLPSEQIDRLPDVLSFEPTDTKIPDRLNKE